MDEWTWMPDTSRLDVQGRAMMMGFLESRLDRLEWVSQTDWREAYGAAIDDQTARHLHVEISRALLVGAGVVS